MGNEYMDISTFNDTRNCHPLLYAPVMIDENSVWCMNFFLYAGVDTRKNVWEPLTSIYQLKCSENRTTPHKSKTNTHAPQT
jgi:hypothetical protein